MNIWQGERIRLRALEPEDAEFLYEFNLDSNTQINVDQIWFPISKNLQKQWAEETSKKYANHDAFFFVIVDREGNVVGSINTHHCDAKVGEFKYGITIKNEYRRKGYASEAILLVLRVFFLEFRYQKVTVEIASFNEESIKLHEKLNFVKEGCIRNVYYTNGEYFNKMIYGMTKEEYLKYYEDVVKFWLEKSKKENE